ncbi:hypothetical protein KUTeg_013500, partial [Tegillarca granosa]
MVTITMMVAMMQAVYITTFFKLLLTFTSFILILLQKSHAMDVKPQKEKFTPNYSFYHNITGLERKIKALSNKYPDWIKVDLNYKSRNNRPQFLIHVTDFKEKLIQTKSIKSEKLKVLFSYGEHAREFLPTESMLYLLENITTGITASLKGTSQWLFSENILTNVDLYLIAMANPDGRKYIELSQNYCWRGTSTGVDLERNFDWQFGGKGSSGSKSDEEYRGKKPFSEPETVIYTDITDAVDFDIFVSFHSGINQIYIPYADISLDELSTWKLDSLRSFLCRRGLSTDGSKAELTALCYAAAKMKISVKPSGEDYLKQIEKDYMDLLTLESLILPDPLKLCDGWVDETDGISVWPPVFLSDIANFLMANSDKSTTTKYLNEYKVGKAYEYFSSRWIKEVFYHKISKESMHCFLRAKCTPSQRVNEEDHTVWTCVDKDTGVIRSAYCSCTAGLGQTCNHVAGLLFRLEAANKLGLSTCTSLPCTWDIPCSRSINIEPKLVSEIIIKKSRHGKGVEISIESEAIAEKKNSNSQKTNSKPDNLEAMEDLAWHLSKATKFKHKYGNAFKLTKYAADGTIFDYMAGVRKIPFSYTIELWGLNHKGPSCFDLFNPRSEDLQNVLKEIHPLYASLFTYLIEWKSSDSLAKCQTETVSSSDRLKGKIFPLYKTMGQLIVEADSTSLSRSNHLVRLQVARDCNKLMRVSYRDHYDISKSTTIRKSCNNIMNLLDKDSGLLRVQVRQVGLLRWNISEKI